MDSFITIKDNVQTEIIEKKSRFIANLYYIESVKEAEEIISKTKKKNFDARHNCVAYRVIEQKRLIEKSSDDGEPSGTAGAPMLNILQKNNLVNILVIVTRYFGGILLGTGGLVRAYSNSLLHAIEKSEKVEKCYGQEFEVILDYNEFEYFKYYCKNNNINIVETKYLENIVCKIEIEDKVKMQLISDFETKKININNIKELSKKYITKSK